MTNWISIYGPPKKILSDLGGEFINDAFKIVCEQYGILHLSTAAESPWSNGVVERHNGVLLHSMRKMCHDFTELDIEVSDCLCACPPSGRVISGHHALENFPLGPLRPLCHPPCPPKGQKGDKCALGPCWLPRGSPKPPTKPLFDLQRAPLLGNFSLEKKKKKAHAHPHPPTHQHTHTHSHDTPAIGSWGPSLLTTPPPPSLGPLGRQKTKKHAVNSDFFEVAYDNPKKIPLC